MPQTQALPHTRVWCVHTRLKPIHLCAAMAASNTIRALMQRAKPLAQSLLSPALQASAPLQTRTARRALHMCRMCSAHTTQSLFADAPQTPTQSATRAHSQQLPSSDGRSLPTTCLCSHPPLAPYYTFAQARVIARTAVLVVQAWRVCLVWSAMQHLEPHVFFLRGHAYRGCVAVRYHHRARTTHMSPCLAKGIAV